MSGDFCGMGGSAERKLHFEGAALAQCACDFDVAEVFFNDAAD